MNGVLEREWMMYVVCYGELWCVCSFEPGIDTKLTEYKTWYYFYRLLQLTKLSHCLHYFAFFTWNLGGRFPSLLQVILKHLLMFQHPHDLLQWVIESNWLITTPTHSSAFHLVTLLGSYSTSILHLNDNFLTQSPSRNFNLHY